jgi:hypothetical protein
MKIETLLRKAKKCVSDNDANGLLIILERVFGKSRKLSHLYQANSASYLDADGNPHIHFDMNRLLSNDYIIAIRPEIRNDSFSVIVETNLMLDGLGMMSKSWKTIEGMEACIESYPGCTVCNMINRAVEMAILHHRILIEKVGVPQDIAETTAIKCW